MKKTIKIIALVMGVVFLMTGCSSTNNQLTLEEITNSKWHLVDIKGFDQQKEAYQKFYVSFSEGRFGGKAFNSFNTQLIDINNNGTIDLSPNAITTRMALRSKDFAKLESTFIQRAVTAKTWHTEDQLFILGSGENQLTFKRNIEQ